MLSLRNLRIVMKPSMANNLFKHALSTTSSLNAKVAVVYKNQWRVIGLLLGLSLHFVINLFVVLSGCGVYDGSEVHEASAVLVHLSRHQSQVSMFAPDIPQMHAIDHTKGEPMEHNRNVLTESARIARGKIQALSDLNPQDFDAVVFPGGFGAAKNLSTFAVDGTSMKVNEDVEKVIKQFHSEKKAIGMCCIAPVLAAKVIQGCEVTVGSDQEEGGRWPYAGTAGAVQSMGSTHIKKNVTDIHVDEKNKLVTTPAFMCETAVHEIYDGIGKMIEGVLKLAK